MRIQTDAIHAPTVDDVRRSIRSSAPRHARLFVILLVAGICSAIALAAGRAATGRKDAMGFVTSQVERREIRVTVTATGTLQALTTVQVGAEVTGKITSVRTDANDAVKTGDILATIDPQQLRAAADQAAAQVGVASAAVRQARATKTQTDLALEHAKAQQQAGLLSRQDYETAVANAERADAGLGSARANETLARAQLNQAQTQLSKTTIVAPVDGIVLARYVELGQTVTAGFQTPVLFKIARDLTKMKLDVDVDEADVGRVFTGASATFTVEAYPTRVFDSKVVRIGNEPTTTSNVVTYQAVLSLANEDGALRPGMTCTAVILARSTTAASVPNAALRFVPPTKSSGPGPPVEDRSLMVALGPGDKRVFTLKGGRLAPVVVKTGATDGVFTEIVSGVDVGTSVVTDVSGLR